MRHCAHQSPPSPHKNQETIGTPISNERSSRSQGTMGTPERPEVKTAFYSQISQAWQGPVKTSAFSSFLLTKKHSLKKFVAKFESALSLWLWFLCCLSVFFFVACF